MGDLRGMLRQARKEKRKEKMGKEKIKLGHEEGNPVYDGKW